MATAATTSPVLFLFSLLTLTTTTTIIIIITITTAATATSTTTTTTTPYLSPTILFQNYQNMLTTFKIFIYTPSRPFTFPTPPSSLFYTTLLSSPLLTQDPNEAHLFFLPFSPETSTRSMARLVREIRNNHPYWNRTLGADHFFISPAGIDFSSDRNVVELKKNSVQISMFPTTSGKFIPHKDITFPPFNPSPLALSGNAPVNQTTSVLGYLKCDGGVELESGLVNELKMDADFVVEYVPSDHLGRVKSSKFCLFFYRGDVAWIAEAMALGCVPVVIVDRWIQDLPLMDVLRWSDLAVLAGTRGGVKGLKEVLVGISEEKYEKMKGLCVEASKNLMWNADPQPLDAFHSVMYQLWLRRHTIRYARRESI